MGSYTMGPPPELVEKLKKLFDINTFVETGTWKGDTTLWAAGVFDQVYTAEASKSLFDEVQPKFIGNPVIKSVFGESDKVLYSLLPTLPPSMFFLDAHYSGGETAGAKSECPLLTELAVIMPWFRKHVILIDDARLFVKPPQPPHQISEWPSLDDILRASQGTAYTAIYNDVIVLVPAFFRAKVAEIIQSLA